jgi:TonB family protein
MGKRYIIVEEISENNNSCLYTVIGMFIIAVMIQTCVDTCLNRIGCNSVNETKVSKRPSDSIPVNKLPLAPKVVSQDSAKESPEITDDILIENNSDNVNELSDLQKPPSFPGGEQDLLEYFQRSLIYPPLARENKIEGIVNVSFVIGKDGKVRDARILKDIGSGCGEESLRVIESMPNWIPGERKGELITTRFTLPIRFKLPKEKYETREDKSNGTFDREKRGIIESIGGGLMGRRVIVRPRMVDNTQKVGRIVLEVCVDGNGNVISAEYLLKGSTTNDDELLNNAITWTKNYRFSSANTPKECGTVAFGFNL